MTPSAGRISAPGLMPSALPTSIPRPSASSSDACRPSSRSDTVGRNSEIVREAFIGLVNHRPVMDEIPTRGAGVDADARDHKQAPAECFAADFAVFDQLMLIIDKPCVHHAVERDRGGCSLPLTHENGREKCRARVY